MDVIAVKAAAEYALSTLRTIVKQDKENKTKWKAAVALLQEAVLETKAYVASLERGNAANLNEEHRLVGLWSTAANGFYTLDGSLAARLQLKAEYWTQPELWSSAQVRDAGIALDHVAAYTRQLLHESK